jgi:hypothetical protein
MLIPTRSVKEGLRCSQLTEQSGQNGAEYTWPVSAPKNPSADAADAFDYEKAAIGASYAITLRSMPNATN